MAPASNHQLIKFSYGNVKSVIDTQLCGEHSVQIGEIGEIGGIECCRLTITDTEQNGETKYVVESRVVWPKDKDGNIIYPSWWNDEEMNRKLSRREQLKNLKESPNLIEDELQDFGDLKTSLKNSH